MKGWSVRRERVQTGHGVFEELPCLVFEAEGREPQQVAYLADGRLEHADTYNPYRSVPLEALQLLLEHDGWVVTPSESELARRFAALAKRQRFEARLRADPKFAAAVTAAEARAHGEPPRMLADRAREDSEEESVEQP